jgi:hypothetical protein
MDGNLKSVLYVSSGFFLVYISTEVYSYISSFLSNTTNKAIPPANILVFEVFPFSFIPSTTPTNSIQMNMERFDLLAKAMDHVEYCSEAVQQEMLFHKVKRILFEKPNPSIKEVRACLWLLVHLSIKLGSECSDLFLSVFKEIDFFKFFEEKSLDVTKAKELFGLYKGYYDQNGLYITEALMYPVEIVYLAYVLVANLYSIALNDDKLVFESKSVIHSIASTFLTVLNETRDDSFYKKIPQKNQKSIGLTHFDDFLNITFQYVSCDNVSLVKLALATLGQFVAVSNDSTLAYLLEHPKLQLSKCLSNVILCNQVNVLQILGKTLFTIFLRDVSFTRSLTNGSFGKELIQLAIINDDPMFLKLQYMNILYLAVVANPDLAKALLENQKLGVLELFCTWLESPDVDLNFMTLQLIVGCTTHHPDPIIKHTRKRSVLDFVRHFTFVPQKILRYYSLVIWTTMVQSKNYLEHLVKKEQLWTVLTKVVQEEKDPHLAQIAIKIIQDLTKKENAGIILDLLGSYDILFLLVDRLRATLDTKRKDLEENAVDMMFLLIKFIEFDPNVKETLIPYGIKKYFNDLQLLEPKLKEYAHLF